MSDIDQVIKNAEVQGWRHERTNNNHHKFLAPDGINVVVTSGTPSAPSQWQNFMADMRRAGYEEHPEDTRPKLPNGGGRLSVKQYVVDILSRHPEGVWAADINAYVMSQRPELGRNVSYGVVSDMLKKGLVEKKNEKYILAGRPIVFRTARTARTAHPASATKHLPATISTVNGSDTSSMADDLKVLDEALEVLSKLDGIIRRNQEVAKQLASLKTLLGGK